ncbi:hypothetical protein [Streptomyces anulatus]
MDVQRKQQSAPIYSMEEKDRAGQDVVADHQDLALDAALAGGPLGG